MESGITHMRAIMIDQRCRFKNPDPVSIGRGNLARIRATIDTADLHIAVTNPRNDLNSLKCH